MSWDNWVLPHLGSQCIETATERVLLDCVLRYQMTPGPKGPHTERGIRNLIINITAPIRFLLRNGHIRKHPILPIVPKDLPEPKIHFVEPEELENVVERFDRYVNYDLYSMIYIRVMGFAGLRTSNARQLKKESFRLTDGTFDTGITKNGNRYRLPIPEDLTNLLKRIPNFDEPGLLLPTNKQEKRSGGWRLGILKRVFKDLGLDDTKAWHTLRASYATFLARSNVDLMLIKDLLGHETLLMVMRYAGRTQNNLVAAQSKGIEYVKTVRRNRR